GQLGRLGHVRLSKQRGLFGIETAGEKIKRDAMRIFAQCLRIAQAGERVVIGDEIKSLALLLELDRRPHHSEIISDVQHAAGLDAGKDSHAAQRSTFNAQRSTSKFKIALANLLLRT